LSRAVETAFDRDTGRGVQSHRLKSYAEALSSYHLHPESKFLNGDYLDSGPTRRRHVRVATVQHIGKEANDLERQAVLGPNADAIPSYGVGAIDRAFLSNDLRPLAERWGIAACARAFGISAATLRFVVDQSGRVSERTLQHIAARLFNAKRLFERINEGRRMEIAQLRELVDEIGLRPAARELGIDPSNLRRKLSSLSVARKI
jgi:hypothetical protein